MPLANTVSLLKQCDFSHQRRCSFEYICFGGLNDSPLYAREIAKLLEGLNCRVNLIRFHRIPGVNLPPSDEQRMEAMRDYLTHHGVTTTIRASRGEDILAACGMLTTAKQALLNNVQ
jgi:23S rRNA (adenine2503-C2)-methyltransferase